MFDSSGTTEHRRSGSHREAEGERATPAYPTDSTSEPVHSPKVERNARITVNSAVVLAVLFVIEVVTVVIKPRSVLTLHVVVGLLLVPPLLVKLGSVTWRMVGYYRGDADFKRNGAPSPVLRVLGPLLTLATVAVLTSGIVLLLSPAALGGSMRRIHSLSFYLWLILVIAHVALHVRDIRRIAPQDWVRASRRAVPGAFVRQMLLLASLAAGVVLALSLVSHVGSYKPYNKPGSIGSVSHSAPLHHAGQ
jgi:hypothetical protein